MLWDFREVFSDKPGVCNIASHKIKLKEDFKPTFTKPYRIPEKFKPEVDRQIHELLKEGKMQSSKSPYVHPIVLVSKPDNSLRLCIDYRCVNAGDS